MAIDWKTRWALAESGKLYELCAVVCGVDPDSIAHERWAMRHTLHVPASMDKETRRKLETVLELAVRARMTHHGLGAFHVGDPRLRILPAPAFGDWARRLPVEIGLRVPERWCVPLAREESSDDSEELVGVPKIAAALREMGLTIPDHSRGQNRVFDELMPGERTREKGTRRRVRRQELARAVEEAKARLKSGKVHGESYLAKALENNAAPAELKFGSRMK